MAPHCPGRSTDARGLVLAGQADVLSDDALFAILVGEGCCEAIDSLVVESRSGGLWGLDPARLLEIKGLGPVKAARVLACVEMSRRAAVWECGERTMISGPEDVMQLCGPQLAGRTKEHFWALALNTKNRLLHIIEVSVGSLNASIVHPRELYKDAVSLSAASVVVVHNHPSGDPTPSGADIQLTHRLQKAGDVMGIELLDHVIVGGPREYTSLKDMGVM